LVRLEESRPESRLVGSNDEPNPFDDEKDDDC
jgi:hypothetical protein